MGVKGRKQPFYPERALYYSTFQIQRQVESGAENYDFLPVYVVNILNLPSELMSLMAIFLMECISALRI